LDEKYHPLIVAVSTPLTILAIVLYKAGLPYIKDAGFGLLLNITILIAFSLFIGNSLSLLPIGRFRYMITVLAVPLSLEGWNWMVAGFQTWPFWFIILNLSINITIALAITLILLLGVTKSPKLTLLKVCGTNQPSMPRVE